MSVLPLAYSQTGNPRPSQEPKDKRKDDGASFHYQMGLNYYDGLGDKPNFVKAVEHFKQAAKLNHAQAQGMLGQCYRKGRGVNRDLAKAAHWIELASKQNDTIANFLYGTLLATGQGTPLDYKKAMTFYLKAAAKGHAPAMNNIGALHEQGHGVPKNFVEAAKWYRMAAGMNLPNAQCNLGQLFASGRGVPKNPAEALIWYQKAASQDHPQAQFLLGSAYHFGKGVKHDPVKAYQWINLSANHGNPSAIQHRGTIANKLTPTQIQEASKQISIFRAKHSPNALILKREALTGTGFFISTEGHLLTSHHLIAQGRRIEVRIKTGNYSAELIKTDPANDIALLKIKAQTTPLYLNSQKRPEIGQSVFTIGFPNRRNLGAASTYTAGKVSSLFGLKNDPRLLQLSAPIQPGNLGGALVDEHGTTIGIINFSMEYRKPNKLAENLNLNIKHALKATHIKQFLATVPLVQACLPRSNTPAASYSAAIELTQRATAFILVYD
tara:strand:- start:1162 stop:2649 length:1488 start_codon:yes stop_codon:yes gene_type:complete